MTDRTDRADPERNARDTLALVALVLVGLIVVLGAIALIVEDNLYSWDDYLHDLALTLFGVAATIAALNHFRRDRRDRERPQNLPGTPEDRDPLLATDPLGGTTVTGRPPRRL